MLPPLTSTPNSPDMSDAEQHTPQFDGAEDEEDLYLYGDQDGAQSFMQPAISPIATRLTSARTPATEKAAAMDEQSGGGYFDDLNNGAGDRLLVPSLRNLGSAPPQAVLPVWEAGPKEFSIVEPTSPRPLPMSGVFHSRQQRSSSLSENALKRLSKALPSISIPTGLMSSISTPSFFSSFSASFQKDGPAVPSSPISHVPRSAVPSHLLTLTPDLGADLPPLRKSNSDGSLLYHSLSRVSSFGDDERFAHVREQVNSRFKAIKDSFDGPSFKMPQFHSMSTTCAKKTHRCRCRVPEADNTQTP